MPSENRPVVVITDCDHADTAIEAEVAERMGFELRVAQCTTAAEVIEHSTGAQALLTQYAPVTDEVLTALPSVRAVGRYGVGVDTVDLEAATAHGVAVCNVPDYGTEDVSSHAIAHALTLLRGIGVLDKAVRRGSADLAVAQPLHRFAETTIGIFGLGLIGEATAAKARALGFRVIGTDPRYTPGQTTPDGTEAVTVASLYAESDLISLHLPLIPATHHLINAEAFSQMKPGVKLVNTCRGGVIDTNALVEALTAGIVSGAGLDVFETEPLPVTSELLSFEQVMLTPHAAWYSEESIIELKRRAMENVLNVCLNDSRTNVVNARGLGTVGGQQNV